MINLNKISDFLKETVVSAGDLAVRLRSTPAREQRIIKGTEGDFATASDIEVENFICQKIKETFPTAKIFAEEGTKTKLSPETFIIDPIDGTKVYADGQSKEWGIMIAWYSGSNNDASCIYLPDYSSLLFAAKDKGATELDPKSKKEKKLDFSSKNQTLLQLTSRVWGVSSCFSPDRAQLFQNDLKTKTNLLDHQQYPFMASAYVAKLFAENKLNLVANIDPIDDSNVWDIFPVTTLIKEGGGVAVGIDRGDIVWQEKGNSFCASSSAKAAEEFLELVRKYKK
ncbi:MAG TPA: inositol monophosphatase family protein [Oligoflexia bacterium]|nr:inositol monophosphatase family protein [Oligoflexia bacterium]HMP26833.1 inositol monophosphatase family protein [Oligoflexia bacterium]